MICGIDEAGRGPLAALVLLHLAVTLVHRAAHGQAQVPLRGRGPVGQRPAGAAGQSWSTSPYRAPEAASKSRAQWTLVQVQAQYRIQNPTDQEVAADFGFPILLAHWPQPRLSSCRTFALKRNLGSWGVQKGSDPAR